MTTPFDPRAHRAGGFTLVEVLVALVVLSVGLLGLATLSLEGLRVSRDALHGTHAVALAADLADRVRANRAPVDAYRCPDPCRAGAGGNAAAVTDVALWLDDVAARLPEGTAEIGFVAAAGTTPAVYTVTVRWQSVGRAGLRAYQLRFAAAGPA
jgi:type IV pilus assembly protein PilV